MLPRPCLPPATAACSWHHTATLWAAASLQGSCTLEDIAETLSAPNLPHSRHQHLHLYHLNTASEIQEHSSNFYKCNTWCSREFRPEAPVGSGGKKAFVIPLKTQSAAEIRNINPIAMPMVKHPSTSKQLCNYCFVNLGALEMGLRWKQREASTASITGTSSPLAFLASHQLHYETGLLVYFCSLRIHSQKKQEYCKQNKGIQD